MNFSQCWDSILNLLVNKKFGAICEYVGALALAPEAIGVAIGHERAQRVMRGLAAISRHLTRDRLWDALIGPFGKVVFVTFIFLGSAAIVFDAVVSFRSFRAIHEIASTSATAVVQKFFLLLDRFDLWVYLISLPLLAPAIFFFGAAKGISLASSQAIDVHSSNVIEQLAAKIVHMGFSSGRIALGVTLMLTAALVFTFNLGLFIGGLVVQCILWPITACLRFAAFMIEPARLRRVTACVGILMLTAGVAIKLVAE